MSETIPRRIVTESKMQEPGLDYPTAWAIQDKYKLLHDNKCSAAITNGALLCDCDALWIMWRGLGKPTTAAEVWDEQKDEEESA
jgi:hypothetical protein